MPFLTWTPPPLPLVVGRRDPPALPSLLLSAAPPALAHVGKIPLVILTDRQSTWVLSRAAIEGSVVGSSKDSELAGYQRVPWPLACCAT